jgi:hypothetical protein
VLVNTLAPKTQSASQRPVTYGDLFDAACQAVRTAVLLPQRQQLTPDSAHDEILGYQRFLRMCGAHLQLLSRFQQEVTPEHRHLMARLADVPDHGGGPSNWLRASQLLGAAHDLLATHLDHKLVPRTVEAEEALGASSVIAPTSALTALVLDAINAAPHLIQAAGDAQKGKHLQPIPYPWLAGLRGRTNSLRPFAKAVHLDASRLAPEGESSPMTILQAAPIVASWPPDRSTLDSPVAAMRLLRQLTMDQAHGRVDASPMSLRDLAQLGTTITKPDLACLPAPTTSLQRLERAHALDALESAQTSWAAAAEGLTEVVLGLTRAPHLYGDAIGRVAQTEDLRPSVRLALLAALPRLGQDAALTIETLHSKNALVSRQRDGARLAMVWRPISHRQADALASRFHNAAVTSRQAATTVRRVTARPESTARRASTSTPPTVRREVDPLREVSR